MANAKTLWTELAASDLDQIESLIFEDNPDAALQQVIRIIDVVETYIADRPRMGKPGRIDGTRELAVSGTPYIIMYRLFHQNLEILRVLHGARQWPEEI
ncbi:MAG: type II toxin-antitoxin system RelE/ParE family toxin [Acidobacteria bacterium]|nr:MAG: type II toxin-antitoxin system RelE/ParE family toxin [Acidobacteriota bacterium]